MDAGDGSVRLGALNLKSDRNGVDSGPDVSVSSPVTRQKAAAAKQFIENHYKNYLQGLQDRKDRFRFLFRFLNIFFSIYYFGCLIDLISVNNGVNVVNSLYSISINTDECLVHVFLVVILVTICVAFVYMCITSIYFLVLFVTSFGILFMLDSYFWYKKIWS